ncbi:MAG: M28 family peptidase [Cytophagales bacterium]|nr:MAG: M28 family peptidase [Cytophagales bacterium]
MKNNRSKISNPQNHSSIILWMILAITALLFSCNETSQKQATKSNDSRPIIKAPSFNSDSAYYFIAQQVAFGHRIPNSVAHVKCGDYLVNQLKKYNFEVIEQNFQARAFDGTMLKSRNIIASINPQSNKRILLAAHWDSRPFAEKDSIQKNTPIDGANDGASGVGVLIELARVIQISEPKLAIGIDIIFFDSEDYGYSEGMPGTGTSDSWCLGSQYWAKNKHTPNYSAYYGILLDMVGAKDAVFAMEGTSMNFAPEVMQKIWNTAHKAGFGQFFTFEKTPGITDDHSYVNNIARIPMIDIIEYNDEANSYFGWYHHTHKDNMEIIDKITLNAVGQTLLEVLYNE